MEESKMKKIVLILCAAVLALMSCNKDLTPNEAKRGEPIDVVFNLSATHPDGGGTKAVKDAWETGDVVFVFFSGQTAPAYLEMKYDGSSWVNTSKSLSLTEGETGTMTAVYLPFGSDAVVEADGTGYKFDKTYYSFFLTSSMDYTVTGGEVSGTFAMQIPDGYVQFFLAENPNIIYSEDWPIELREPHLMPMGVASISASGDVATTSLAQGAPLPGYMYDKEVKGEGESKGFVFSGILSEDARNVGTDYHFTLVEGGWNGFHVSKTIEDKKLYRGPQAGRALNLQKSGWEEMDYIPIDLGCDVDGRRIYWAYQNVGAEKPEDYGDYFAWGETVAKTDYSWSTYFDTGDGGSTFTKYATDKKTVLDLEDDAARQIGKGTWRIPTDAEWTALRDEANFKWDRTDNYEGTGVAGQIVTSKVPGYEGNHIFLPAAGYRSGTSLNNTGSYGGYWSSSLCEYLSDDAVYVFFDSVGVYRSYDDRYYGFSVRPVSE